MADELTGLTGFLYEQGLLKRYKRTGWQIVGVSDPESIAEHAYRTAIIAACVATMEGANPERATMLAVFHDSQESRILDIPYISKHYLKPSSNEEVTDDQTRGLPGSVAKLLQDGVREYEDRKSLAARCARDADKLECLIQALEYRERGYENVRNWIDTSLAALTTESAKRIAGIAMNTRCLDWLDNFFDGQK